MQSKLEDVKRYILHQIDIKRYTPGQMIESESVLCDTLQISRMTVRKALDELAKDGIIYKEKGRGTFIAQKPKYAQFRCGVAFSEEAVKRGMRPSTKDTTISLIKADQEVAKQLQINENELVWYITRVRCCDDVPVIYACEYYRYDQCPSLQEKTLYESVYAYLQDQGIALAYMDQTMEAVACPEQIAMALDIPSAHPVILMSVIAYMKNGVPFNCGYEYYRTDKFTLVQSVYPHN